jgi:hypothetical protein
MDMTMQAQNELEATLFELEDALNRGEVSGEELDAVVDDADADDDALEAFVDEAEPEGAFLDTSDDADEEDSMEVFASKKRCKHRKGYKPKVNGWYVCGCSASSPIMM